MPFYYDFKKMVLCDDSAKASQITPTSLVWLWWLWGYNKRTQNNDDPA
jgi:hypothetical protein